MPIIHIQKKMNKRDKFYFWYFLIHIPVTFLVDSSIIIPRDSLLSFQVYLCDLHLTANKDFLLQNPPLWLKYFGFFELFLQLPIFFAAAYKLYHGSRSVLVIMSLYGFNAFFTTGVCLAYVFTEASTNGLTNGEKWNLIGLYSPYFIIPFIMMVDCGLRAMSYIRVGQTAESEKKNE